LHIPTGEGLRVSSTQPSSILLSGIRDADLVKRLSEAAPLVRRTVQRDCESIQAKRDALAALPDGKRRRLTTAQLLEEGAQRDDLQHIHSVLAICSLPYTRQDVSKREWERKQGQMKLLVQAGKLMSPSGDWVEQPLPFGSRARLLLLHTCSEAIRQNKPVIEIEDSLSGFMKAMGLKVTGGKNGSLNSFKQQINALAACSMSIGLFDGNKSSTVSAKPFSKIDVWFQKDPTQPMLWPSTLTFSPEFYQTLRKHALPVNMHAVRAFSASARKLDLLFWLGFRLHDNDTTKRISWAALQEQFGDGYSRMDNFQRDFVREINEIKDVFPKLPVKFNETGISIAPGTSEVLAIPPK
jgi:hypothetical protein